MSFQAQPQRFGFPIELWDAARNQAHEVLVAQARVGKSVAYSELVGRIGAIHLEPDSHALAALLGEISTDEDESGGGMLSVLLVHKTGDMMPGNGFFELAARLGKDVSDRDKLWIQEFNRVLLAWKS